MASRSLGTLTLDLIAKIGGFVQGMDKAAIEADKSARKIAADAKKRAKETEDAWKTVGDKIGNYIGAGIAALTVGSVFQKFIGETKQAANEQAQLEAVLKSTGESAGWSQEKLNDMADAIAKATTFGGGDINQAQTRLLSYTGVVGEEFPRALQAAVDMATRLGMEVPAAAEAVGKALDSPKDGLEALSKQGFRFTDDQKALVEQLQKTGDTATAQGIILTALESAYGGAAAAARDTFGGALSALQENINDLLTGDSGSMAKLKTSVESLNTTLSDDKTKAAFQTLTSWMTELSTATIRGAANLVTFINTKNKIAAMLGVDDFGKAKTNAEDYSRLLTTLTNKAIDMQGQLNVDPDNAGLRDGLDKIRARITEVQRKASDASLALKGMANLDAPLPSTAAAPDPKKPPPDATGAAAAAKAREKAARDGEAAQKKALADALRTDEAAKKYVQTLADQIAKTQNLTAYQEVLRDVKDGTIKLDAKQLEQALNQATLVDMAKEQTEAEKKKNEMMERGQSIALSLMTPMEQLTQTTTELDELLANGAITWEFYGRAGVKALNDYAEAVPGVKKSITEMDEFTLQAARNIQDSLGTGVRSLLDGDFKSIGSSWKNMLKDMAAQAIAAQIGKYLLGDFGKTIDGKTVTEVGGVVGSGFTALKGMLGFADGGRPPLGKVSIVGERGPELFVPDSAGTVIPNHAMRRTAGADVPALASGALSGSGGMGQAPVIINRTTGRVDKASMSPDGSTLTLEEVLDAVAGAHRDPASRISKSVDSSYKLQRKR